MAKPQVNLKTGKLFVSGHDVFGVIQLDLAGDSQHKNTVSLKGPHGGPAGTGFCTPLEKHGNKYHFGVFVANGGRFERGNIVVDNISFTITNDANETSLEYPLVLAPLPAGTIAYSVS